MRDSSLEISHITALKKYANIYFRNVDILTYDSNTPTEGWARNRLFNSSKVYKTIFRDYLTLIRYGIIRVAECFSYLKILVSFYSLYKWGGIWMPHDMIITESLNDLRLKKENLGSKEYSGIVSFAKNEISRNLIGLCLRLVKTW